MKTTRFRDYINLSTLAAAAGTVWAGLMSFQYLFICKLSISASTSDHLLKEVAGLKTIVLHGNYGVKSATTKLDVLVKIPGTLFARLEVCQEGKNDPRTTTLTFFRWDLNRITKYLDKIEHTRMTGEAVAVEMVSSNYHNGNLIGIVGHVQPPYLDKQAYAALEADFAKCALGERAKVGIIIYGEPGNGKTSLIRYLSNKYRMPMRFVVFNQYMDNEDLTSIFSKLPKRCILIMEDFDKILKKDGNIDPARAGCSLDSLLNGIDGVYSNYQGVVFVMTCKSLTKLDQSIKNRPSRFKHKLQILPPDRDMREIILGKNNPHLVEKSEGWSLDQVLTLAEGDYDV